MTSLYQNLDVWKKSMKLTKQIYSLTHDFPNYELYGLTSQIDAVVFLFHQTLLKDLLEELQKILSTFSISA